MIARWLSAPLARLWASPYILLFLPPLFWSGNFVLGRGLNEVFPPVSLAFWRWVLALIILAPFVARPLWRQRSVLARDWKLLLLFGALGVAGYNAFIYIALQTTPTVNAAVVNSAIPILIPLFVWAVARERVAKAQIAGIALSVVGVLWIVARGDLTTLRTLAFQPGDLWILAAVFDWALYSAILRFKPKDLEPPVFLAATIIFGLAVLTPFWLWEWQAGAEMPTDPLALAVVLYIGLFASVLAFICWNRCVQLIGATTTGLSIHLMPVFATTLALLFLGERIFAYHLLGAGLILVGIFLSTLGGRRAVRASEGSAD